MKISNIVQKEGEGYDASLGIFTTIIPGIYIFTVSTFVNAGTPYLFINYTEGGMEKTACSAFANQEKQVPLSCTATLMLTQGDQVYIKERYGHVRAHDWTTFTWVLLRNT